MSLANNTLLKKTSSSSSDTTDSPYLGSKISLISKAKIRYEGILYTIDANESTVALSKVRSFGTEDRPTDRPVSGRDEIYEYIIFRGADIEDLQVREPPKSSLTRDPAIVESSTYSDNARSKTTGAKTNLGGLSQKGQTRSLSNRGTNSSPPPLRRDANKGWKSFEPYRQFNYNQQRPSRRFDPESPVTQYRKQDYFYGPQRRARQQEYYNDYIPNRRYNAYAEWPRQSQRLPRRVQNYNDNRFYSSKRQRRNSTGGISSNRQQRDRSNVDTDRSILKFTGDFDFEKSNAEFDKNAIEDEIKKKLSTESSKSETSSDSPKTEEEKEKEKDKDKDKQDKEKEKEKEDQTKKSSSTKKLEQKKQETNPDGYYDKQKSFFDRISRETDDKDKKTDRRNWNKERRVNAETFGLKYRPIPQDGNQRSTYRRNYNTRYQRTGNGGYGDRKIGYYDNYSSRVRAY